MNQKLYTEMTAEEQLQWMKNFTEFVNGRLDRLVRLRTPWDKSGHDEMKVALNLIGAWPFAQDFVEKAIHYGDFEARAGRLKMYFERCKAEIGKTLTMKGSDGRTFALVKPTVPMRRRGRPTLAEVEARKNGLEVPKPQDAEMETQIMIARMMGIEVIISDEAPREKNNAELAAERAKREAKEREMNPSLFDGGNSGNSGNSGLPAAAPTSMGEIYQDRIENDRLHLSDIKWLCSKELQERIDMVRTQRTAFGDAAQAAKLLADRGAKQDEIAAYAQQADEAREAFESTYAAVDEELAVLHKRLSIDLPYIEKFNARFKGVDLEKVLHITRPYYEKMRKEEPAIDARIKLLIEQDSPEYAAKMKAEEEKKKELADLLRYLKRKDKPNVKQRIETMEKRYARLVELQGEEEAKVYRPIVDAAIADYEANHKKPEKAVVPADSVGGKKSAKQENKKSRNQESKKKGAKGNKGETPNSSEQPVAETINH